MKMQLYYLTFGQIHPLRDCYIIVEAENYARAREAVMYCFGTKWAGLRGQGEFVSTFYVGGPAGRNLNAVEVLGDIINDEGGELNEVPLLEGETEDNDKG